MASFSDVRHDEIACIRPPDNDAFFSAGCEAQKTGGKLLRYCA